MARRTKTGSFGGVGVIVAALCERRTKISAVADRRYRSSCDCAEFALLLDEFGDQAGPAGLMRCAEAGADVAVKIFVK